MVDATVLWRRLDRAGHEWCRLVSARAGHLLEGTAVLQHDGAACSVSYRVVCDGAWRTRSCQVSGWLGSHEVEVTIEVDEERRWRLNGEACPQVDGCVDVDLNFSPSTNLLPLRRLGLAVGAECAVRAAWLRFPSFRLEPLDQTYRRTGETGYRYESAGGAFTADLEVDEEGFVTHYPGFAELVE